MDKAAFEDIPAYFNALDQPIPVASTTPRTTNAFAKEYPGNVNFQAFILNLFFVEIPYYIP